MDDEIIGKIFGAASPTPHKKLPSHPKGKDGR